MTLDRQRTVAAKRCFVCGREGERAFREIPQTTHEPSGQVVGPYTVCVVKSACYRRQREQHQRAGRFLDDA